MGLRRDRDGESGRHDDRRPPRPTSTRGTRRRGTAGGEKGVPEADDGLRRQGATEHGDQHGHAEHHGQAAARQATAPIATTDATLIAAAVHRSDRGSPPDSQCSGAANQSATGPGARECLDRLGTDEGRGSGADLHTRSHNPEKSPVGYQVSPTSDPAATTMVLAASASTASAAIQMTVEAGARRNGDLGRS